MRRALTILAIQLLVPIAGIAQQQTPAFKSRVDLLSVQAAVFDKDGRPVRDLQPSDFTVTVNGQPRKVIFARFSGGDLSPIAAVPSPANAAAPPVPAPPGGKLVMFVVDRDTIRTGTERAMLDATGLVFEALTPADAVGLLGLPTGGVKPTRDHERVRQALAEMTGTMPMPAWRWHITWTEAEGIERQDKQSLAQVLDRECRPAVQKEIAGEKIGPPRVPEGCDTTVPAQAAEMLLTARSQARSTLANLNNMMDRLRPLRGPKHLVIISGGMRFDQELMVEFNGFAHHAALAGVVLHALHVDQASTDSSTSRRNVTSGFGGREMSQGLTTMAGMTGGSFFYGVGSAAGAFDRIRTEIANFYELGLESVAADADGKPRDLSVKVAREGVNVRARSQVALDPSIAPKPGTPEALRTLLEQPTDIGDLPLAVSTFTTRGDDPSLLKVLLSARIDVTPARTPLQWGFIVLNEENVIASGRSTVDTAAAATPLTITASAKLLPGRQRLRFAAIDAEGRAGVVETPLTVGLRAAGDLQFSDLVLGSVAAGRFLPSARVSAGAPLAAMIEVLTNDVPRLAKTRVALEIIPEGTTEPVQRVLMAARTGIADTILLNDAQLPTSTLAPGRYTANATVLVDSQPVGKVTRAFEVVYH